MEIIHKNTEDLQADMLTKSLTPNKFNKFRDEVMGGENLHSGLERSTGGGYITQERSQTVSTWLIRYHTAPQ